MSSSRGRSPSDTGPRKLRLDVIVLARWPLPSVGTTARVALPAAAAPPNAWSESSRNRSVVVQVAIDQATSRTRPSGCG